jgi:hypothetical protein
MQVAGDPHPLVPGRQPRQVGPRLGERLAAARPPCPNTGHDDTSADRVRAITASFTAAGIPATTNGGPVRTGYAFPHRRPRSCWLSPALAHMPEWRLGSRHSGCMSHSRGPGLQGTARGIYNGAAGVRSV